MKFSDAMMIGMSTYPLVAGSLACDGAFCALGAGYRSLGWIDEYGEFIDPGQVLHGYEGRIVHWLKADATDSPCGCESHSDTLLAAHNQRGIIAHIFNRHVMGDKTWTPEKLVDYVRTVEPAEDPELAEQYRAEEEAAAEEGALIEASGMPDPQFESNGRY